LVSTAALVFSYFGFWKVWFQQLLQLPPACAAETWIQQLGETSSSSVDLLVLLSHAGDIERDPFDHPKWVKGTGQAG